MTCRPGAVLAVVALSMTAGRATAQTATFAGAVVRDTLSHGIPGALVAIPALSRSDTTDARGEFKFTGLPPGRYAALIRHIGFTPMVDTLVLVSGANPEREYQLEPSAVTLDSVRTSAAREQPHLSPNLSQFEAHRKAGSNNGLGHFFTEEELRKNEDRKLNDLLAGRIPGLRSFRTGPTSEYLSSGRSACGGPVFQCGGAKPCPVTLYVDGVLTFSVASGTDYPDLTRMRVSDYLGVEYYSGGVTVPMEYNVTSGGCGTLVLWSREKLK